MSNSDLALRVEGLGKRYRIGFQEKSGGRYRYKSLRDSLGGVAKHPVKTMRTALVREPMNEENSFWALKDVNFEVKKGEVVGIIGRNGAGKSTLLKILSRITKPTTGHVALFGRVGSLLEVGTGFHPELSGRENIYLNGAILGMTRAEVKGKFDEIVAFSEVEKFLDTAVKQYSSGMYMRLAFAVAAHLSSEIVVVDEVLAVGDAAFQEKCLGKMKDAAGQGRTVILVSHQLGHLLTVAQRAVLLETGTVITDGQTRQVVDTYRQKLLVRRQRSTGNQNGIHVETVGIRTSMGITEREVLFNEPFCLEFTVSAACTTRMNVELRLFKETGEQIGSCCSPEEGVERTSFNPRKSVCVNVRAANLLPGDYRVSLDIWEDARRLFSEERLATFTIVSAPLRFGSIPYTSSHGYVRFADRLEIRGDG
jgi:lipopolysaccharide transport system ATP-binding protein